MLVRTCNLTEILLPIFFIGILPYSTYKVNRFIKFWKAGHAAPLIAAPAPALNLLRTVLGLPQELGQSDTGKIVPDGAFQPFPNRERQALVRPCLLYTSVFSPPAQRETRPHRHSSAPASPIFPRCPPPQTACAPVKKSARSRHIWPNAPAAGAITEL